MSPSNTAVVVLVSDVVVLVSAVVVVTRGLSTIGSSPAVTGPVRQPPQKPWFPCNTAAGHLLHLLCTAAAGHCLVRSFETAVGGSIGAAAAGTG